MPSHPHRQLPPSGLSSPLTLAEMDPFSITVNGSRHPFTYIITADPPSKVQQPAGPSLEVFSNTSHAVSKIRRKQLTTFQSPPAVGSATLRIEGESSQSLRRPVVILTTILSRQWHCSRQRHTYWNISNKLCYKQLILYKRSLRPYQRRPCFPRGAAPSAIPPSRPLGTLASRAGSWHLRAPQLSQHRRQRCPCTRLFPGGRCFPALFVTRPSSRGETT